MVSEDISKSRGTARKSRKWHRLRRAVQVLTLLLFIYLLLGTTQKGIVFSHDLFFNLDPLAGISAMLASRSWIAPMALGVVTLLLALAVGRAWCSWLCPLGTLLDWTPSRRPSRNRLEVPSYWRQIKYFVLFAILFAALLGSLTLLIFDPITLLFRTITSVLLPAVSFLITAVETWAHNVGPLQPAVEWFDGLVRGLLVTEQPFFLPSLLIALLFAIVLALNAVRHRFWCRYICPLGALLGMVSRVAQVRHRVDLEKCVNCMRCAVICPTGAIDPGSDFAASSAECTTCLDCMEACPTAAITFKKQPGVTANHRYDPSRRQFLASLGAAVVGALLLRTVPVFRQKEPLLVRPPGTSDEKLFSECIRCGECVKVCPTGAIQPSSSLVAWEGLWTPALMMRLGYCDYSCNSCGPACPTGAIPILSLAEKQQTVIGKASIDAHRCIPWAEGIECVVCEEMCPVPGKAIKLRRRAVINGQGERVTVQLPRVKRNLCIGCGICETQCPVNGEAAIRVYPNGD